MSDALLRDQFLDQLDASVRNRTFQRLTLGKPRGGEPTLRNVYVRPVEIRGTHQLSLLWRHERQDITKNFPPDEALAMLASLIGTAFHSAHLFTQDATLQLEYSKKGEPRFTRGPAIRETVDVAHDRAKVRLLPEASQAWLERLGVTTPSGVARTGLADKLRQIHKFVEILSHLWNETSDAAASSATDSPVIDRDVPPAGAGAGSGNHGRRVRVADMGCGKGYLTFAAYDYFTLVAKIAAEVTGIETRPELVALCNQVAGATGRTGLRFEAGSIASAPFAALDVLIALHACDTATDDAIARGVSAGARLIVVAPCCQKELRPQLRAAPVLAPALRHGIFQERQAEFATDALRALMLEWAGYSTKVFEFISTEHTAKNIMIAATRTAGPSRSPAAAQAVRELAAFYGITRHALARQLDLSL